MELIKRDFRDYLVTIFIPSKRFEGLNILLDSIFSKADASLNNFEIIVKIDIEDVNKIDINAYKDLDNINFLVSPKRKGYLSLVDFGEDMVNLSHSKYCFALTDDTCILTDGWNKVLQESLTEFKLYLPLTIWENYPASPQYCFPIFPKKLIEIWGYLSPHSLIDHWLHELANRISNPNLPWNVPFLSHIPNLEIQAIANSTEETPPEKAAISEQLYATCLIHTESPEFFHCLNLLKEYLLTQEINKWKNKNIINEYRNKHNLPDLDI